MKKTIMFLSVLFIIIMVGSSIFSGDLETVFLHIDENNSISLLIDTGLEQEELQAWYDSANEIYYFFLPSFCEGNRIRINDINDNSIYWDGLRLQNGSSLTYTEEQLYTLNINNNNNVFSYRVCLLHSENLPAIFIDTASGNMDYIHDTRDNSEEGSIKVVTANGQIEYNGGLEKINGRGNTTWRYAKKPYSIKLDEKASLLGMDAGKKWVLLAGWRESAKLNTKIAFDMAREIGLAYTPQCQWIDLYLNGEYRGIYYLTENIDVGDGRIEITDLDKSKDPNMSGGYLIEKDFTEYWEKSASRFATASGNKFSIKSPQYASAEQIQYISDYIQQIDSMICAGNLEYENYIDLTSFAKKFIIDEIAINLDMNVTSMFFYKEKDNDLLYAGPVWDFDNSFGEYNSNSANGQWLDHRISIIDPPRNDKEEILYWNAYLYENEAFKELIIEKYTELLPYIQSLLEEKVDAYASQINKSVYLDKIRWDSPAIGNNYYVGHFKEFENNVRYLKYYLVNRVQFLNERWNISENDFSIDKKQESHTVTFMADDKIVETLIVSDGETLDNLPAPDKSKYGGWYYEHNNEKVRPYIPVYEDCVVYAK